MLRTRVTAGAVVAIVGWVAVPTWVAADPTDGTTVTFEITAGTLDIDGPVSANLGSGAGGTTISGLLGPVTVTDGRASADASWDAAVTSTDFVTGAGTATETVVAGLVDYWSGPATATTGNGTYTPGQSTAAAAAPLDTLDQLPAFTHTGGTGNNSATWNPTLDVNAPWANLAGIYTGTVTHSVA
jgi:hypothetical protein